MRIPCWAFPIVYSKLPSAARNVLSITKLTIDHAVVQKETTSHHKKRLRYLRNCNKDLTLVNTNKTKKKKKPMLFIIFDFRRGANEFSAFLVHLTALLDG